MKNISARIISAISIIGFIATAYFFFEKKGLLLIGLIIAALSIYEYNKMSFSNTAKLSQIAFVAFAYAIFYTVFYYPLEGLTIFLLLSITYIILAILNAKNIETSQININRAIIGFFYVGILPALFCRFFLFHKEGLFYLVLTLACVISSDVFAYFAGIRFGKTPLHKIVSPNKTVEGFLAGLFGSLIFTLIFAYMISFPHSLFLLAPFTLIASIAGQFGDLFESLLKRNANVKDSGRILPGHGGVLDRIDSLLFACPVFVIYAKIIYSTFV